MPPVAKVFISYRRKPSAMLATLIAKELETQGIEVFVDTRKGDGAGPFPRHLLTAVDNSDVFVCLLADTTLGSDWVRREIEHAFTMGKTMIPVFQENYKPLPETPEMSIETLLMSQGVHVLDEQNLYIDEAIDHLASMIEQSVPGSADPQGETTVISPPTSPMRPQPPRTRWLWPLSAIIILLVGLGAFYYLNGPPPGGDLEVETQTALALAGGVTDTPSETPTPSETATSALTDTPEPSATTTPTDIPTATSTFTPTPTTPLFVVGELSATVLAAPMVGAEVISEVSDLSLPITGGTDDGFYYRVDYNGEEGWVHQNWGRVEGDLSTVPVFPVLVVGEISVPLQAAPAYGAEVISWIVFQHVPVTGICANHLYYRVDYNGQEGWVHRNRVGDEINPSNLLVVENEAC